MSNRRKARRPELSLHTVRVVNDVHEALTRPQDLKCPDCDSTLGEPVHHGPQVAAIEVRHDPTCPWFRRYLG